MTSMLLRSLRTVCAALVTLAISLGAIWSPARAEPLKVAVFDFELIDTSLQGELEGRSAEETNRLALIGRQLRDGIAAKDAYSVVALTAAARERVAGAGYLYSCNGCEAGIARDLGADLALTGTVQKVSNLILNINLYFRDAMTGKRVKVVSVDIRGNTDQSWTRGVSYILRNRL